MIPRGIFNTMAFLESYSLGRFGSTLHHSQKDIYRVFFYLYKQLMLQPSSVLPLLNFPVGPRLDRRNSAISHIIFELTSWSDPSVCAVVFFVDIVGRGSNSIVPWRLAIVRVTYWLAVDPEESGHHLMLLNSGYLKALAPFFIPI